MWFSRQPVCIVGGSLTRGSFAMSVNPVREKLTSCDRLIVPLAAILITEK